MSEFLHMSGYGTYIWPCYGMSLGALLVLTAIYVRNYRRAKAALEQPEA